MYDKKSLRVQDYIQHILAAIERIESYVEGFDLTAFNRSSLVQDAVIRNFEIFGEAANNIQAADSDFAKKHPQLRLDLAYRMRNALIHGYDSVNLSTVWNTIQNDLLFRIHGTNDPKSIGKAVSSGCIRMLNADVIDLYQRVGKGGAGRSAMRLSR
jgi:uncharacterized protein with HEPN domain